MNILCQAASSAALRSTTLNKDAIHRDNADPDYENILFNTFSSVAKEYIFQSIQNSSIRIENKSSGTENGTIQMLDRRSALQLCCLLLGTVFLKRILVGFE
jgi:hypothetical protein